ncbi:hypothetical protein PoB_007389200 [Plakobranchus ocellatus]|uniref:Uncharacterized protein n=1 Tax=Plakobranchus ocellatus TaxID=259542 RepID=A0AAV4DST6_9GAST|nr:hypothetical protein PoB_007389200 [Plakobranchus ocellatus]
MKISSGSSTSESASTDLDLDLPPSLPSTSTESTSTGSTRTPAQDLIRKELDSFNAKISSFVDVKKTVGLSSELKTDLEKFQKQRDTLQKKLKRKQIEQKSQIKSREKKAVKLQKLMEQVGVESATVTRNEPGRPRLEEEGMENLAEEIYRIVAPEGAADERRRTETLNTIQSIDGLKSVLEKKGYLLSRTALYYRLIPANMGHKDGKRHFSTVNVKLCRPQNTQRKAHVDDHFAFASVKHAKELASLLGSDNSFFLSQDDKARIPMGLPISKKTISYAYAFRL